MSVLLISVLGLRAVMITGKPPYTLAGGQLVWTICIISTERLKSWRHLPQDSSSPTDPLDCGQRRLQSYMAWSPCPPIGGTRTGAKRPRAPTGLHRMVRAPCSICRAELVNGDTFVSTYLASAGSCCQGGRFCFCGACRSSGRSSVLVGPRTLFLRRSRSRGCEHILVEDLQRCPVSRPKRRCSVLGCREMVKPTCTEL